MARQNGESSGGNNVLVVLFFVIIFVALWPYYRPYVARIIVTISVVEARVALIAEPALTPKYAQELRVLLERARPLLQTKGVKAFKPMSNRDIFRVWNIPSRFLSPVFILFAIGVSWHIRSTDVRRLFKKKYSTDDLIKAQARFYPHLYPIANTPIDKLDPRKGPWRIKYTPIEYAIRYQLLRDGSGDLILDENYEYKAAFFDRARARKVFLRQLGPRWNDSLEQLPDHWVAMFGIFAAMAAVDRKGAIAATQQINRTWKMRESKKRAPTFELECSEAIALAKKHWDNPNVVKARRAHAYTLTVMSALADIKFNSGELCCSHYLWLRPTDPLLFYTLHQQGLPQPNVESAGVWVHYQMEKRAGLALADPHIEKAVDGLKTALIEEGRLSSGAADRVMPGTAPQSAGREWKGAPRGYPKAADAGGAAA